MKLFWIGFLLAGTAAATPMATCIAYRWTPEANDYRVASQQSGSGGCTAEVAGTVRFANGTDRGETYASADTWTAGFGEDDGSGFLGFKDYQGYYFTASAQSGGGTMITVNDAYPGATDPSLLYMHAYAEIQAEFFNRSYTIMNPSARLAGFAGSPEFSCGSQSFNRGHCSMDWSAGISPITPGLPFTIVGTISAWAGNPYDGSDAIAEISFRDPASYNFVVLDANGNLIPESQWQQADVVHNPEPISVSLTGIGLLLMWRLRRQRVMNEPVGCSTRQSTRYQ